ncbi:Hypothetical predicted protein [Lecanosticta acicola]|uniref:Uncharacterized protein n=1 Tax=Lecanosticta acicola TaxID=111012 RepID=A0AAI8W0W3_9PEZI|nr:Hypothetical predicted protein [Lecanosticta acicola]
MFTPINKRAPTKGGLDAHAQVAIGVIVPVSILLGALLGLLWYNSRRRSHERSLEFEDAGSRRGRTRLSTVWRGGGRESVLKPEGFVKQADGVDVSRGSGTPVAELDGHNTEKIELECTKKVAELREAGKVELTDTGNVELRSDASRSEENLPSKPKRRALVPPIAWNIPMTPARGPPPRGDSLPQSPTAIRNDSAVEETMARLESREAQPKLTLDTANLHHEETLPPVQKRNTNPFRKSLQPPLQQFHSSPKHDSKRATRGASSRYSRDNLDRFSDVSVVGADEEGVAHEVGFRVSSESSQQTYDVDVDVDLDSPLSGASRRNPQYISLPPAPPPPPPTSAPPGIPEKSNERVSGAEWMKRLSAQESEELDPKWTEGGDDRVDGHGHGEISSALLS